jgi:hypothetical protein
MFVFGNIPMAQRNIVEDEIESRRRNQPFGQIDSIGMVDFILPILIPPVRLVDENIRQSRAGKA